MKILENYNLTLHNSYKIKATCKRAFFPETELDFVNIYKNYYSDLPKILLGGGYNVIFSKEYYEQDFIMIGKTFSAMELVQDNLITCESGVSTYDFSQFALENSLSKAEIYYDIPSSIGGAVVMNAGAGGEEIKDILLKVRYLDINDLNVKEIHNNQIGFQYRNSLFQKETDKIVLKAWFGLEKGNRTTIKSKMEELKESRWAKQPKNLPNAGSVFKRPVGHYVGPMIDQLNLKGFTVGGAKISEKHGGFIVNFNNATGSDILEVIKYVQKKVTAQFGVHLEVEQRII